MPVTLIKVRQNFPLETSCERVEATYTTGTFSSIIFKLTYERMFSFYIRNIILPNSILLFLSGLTFFIPCDMGDRIGFGVTVTLALCVNLIIVIDFVPETSKTIPDLCNYFLVSIFLSGISLLMATISMNFSDGPPHVTKLQERYSQKSRDTQSFNGHFAHGSVNANGVGDLAHQTADGKNDEHFTPDSFDERRCVNVRPKFRSMRRLDMILGAIYMTGSTLYTLIFLLTL